MKILLTGGTGYIGSALAAALAKKHDVRILTRTQHELPYEIVQGNMTNPKDVQKAAKGVDAIFHLAASKDHVADYKTMRSINFIGTKNILETALLNDIEKVICASSVAAGEKIKLGYSQSKAASERLAAKYADNMTVPVVRIAPVYDSRRLRFAQRHFPMPDIDLMLHLVYRQSVIEALIGAWKWGGSKIYTVADKSPVKAKALYETICSFYGRDAWYVPESYLSILLRLASKIEKTSKLFGIKLPFSGQMLKAFLQERSYDITLAKKELRYKPVGTIKTVKKCLEEMDKEK